MGIGTDIVYGFCCQNGQQDLRALSALLPTTLSCVVRSNTGGKECHAEEPGQAGEVELSELHRVQQDQVKGPALGLEQPQVQIKAEQRMI